MQLFREWDMQDPISEDEKLRAEAIMAIQKNCNPYMLNCRE